MRDTWKAARVGLMVAIGVIAAIAVYRYVDERSSAGSGYDVYALFDDVHGLVPKSRVVVAGIPVGYIDQIVLEGAHARVDIRIDGEVTLYEDARVEMRSVSLLGERILAIHPGSVVEPPIEDGGRIMVAAEAVTTDDILQTVGEIAESVKSVTAQLERTLGTDEAGDRIASSLANLSEALASVNRIAQSNEDAIGNSIGNVEDITEEVGPRLIRILDNIESSTESLAAVLSEREPDIDRAVAEVDDTIASIHRASEQLEEVLTDVHEISDRTARGEGTIGRLTSDEALIDEVEGVAEGVGEFVGALNRLQTIVQIRTEYNIMANAFKTYFGLRLQPREDRYYFIEVVDDPRGRVRVREEFVRRSPPIPGEPAEYQQTTITRTDALKFTLIMAKSISFATFRFGIIESSGGIGIDVDFFNERLALSVDLFEMSFQSAPRLRARADFGIVNRLYVVAGIDDVLNGGNRDFFMGLMLRFTDEDLKAILPFAGVAF